MSGVMLLCCCSCGDGYRMPLVSWFAICWYAREFWGVCEEYLEECSDVCGETPRSEPVSDFILLLPFGTYSVF